MVRDAAASAVQPLRAAPTVRPLLTGGVVAAAVVGFVWPSAVAPRLRARFE